MVPAGDGRDEALILETKHDSKVEFCEGNGGGRQFRLGGVLQVRADVSKADEDHGGRGRGGVSRRTSLGAISSRVRFEIEIENRGGMQGRGGELREQHNWPARNVAVFDSSLSVRLWGERVGA